MTKNTIPSKEEPLLSRRKQIATGLLISAMTLFLCLAAVELAGYLWERNTAQNSLGWTLVASRRMPLVRKGTDEQPYYVLEAGEDYNWEGVPVHINSFGFRTEEFALPKPIDTYRILNVGDSVAFGWEVFQEETYGQQLVDLLNERDDGLQYEVINAGAPGWNLETARNFLLQEGLSYDPDLILLDVTIVNDIFGGGPGKAQRARILDWLRDNTHAWPFLTTQARFLLARQQGPEAIPVLNPPRTAEAYYPLNENGNVYDRVWQSIAQIDEMARQNDIPLMVIMFPTAFQLNSAGHPDVPQRALANRASEAGIEIVDLLPTYSDVCDEAVEADACEGYENLLFADVWMHPNALGHEITAEQLEKSLSG